MPTAAKVDSASSWLRTARWVERPFDQKGPYGPLWVEAGSSNFALLRLLPLIKMAVTWKRLFVLYQPISVPGPNTG